MRLGVLAVAMISALLVTTSTAGSQDPIIRDIGTLELFANDVDGDGFVFNDTLGVTSQTEEFSSGGQSRLVETDAPQNLVTLEATASGAGADVGLKDHGIGVRAGRGGTRGAQITGDQTLKITLDGAPGAGATFAELSFKAKFDSTVTITAFDEFGAQAGDPVVKTCDGGSDCGPDSGDDRITVRVPEGPGTTAAPPFTSVVISVSPVDGAATLIDDDASEGAESFETFFNIVEEFDGEIACDVPEASPAGEVSYIFERIGALDENCDVIKPYDEAIIIGGPDEIQFEPDSSIESVYRGDLTFPAGTGAAFFDPLTYDIDLEGPLEDMLPCVALPVPLGSPSDSYESVLASVFAEMGGDQYPELPAGEASCVVAYDTTAGGLEHWVVRLDFDPRYR